MQKQISIDVFLGINSIRQSFEAASALFTSNPSIGVNYNNNDLNPNGSIIELQQLIEYIKKLETTLFVAAMPNMIGDGDVASNFRYKHDSSINNMVVDNWFNVLKQYGEKVGSTVVITVPGRTSRIFTLKMNEDGTIKFYNNMTMNVDREKSDIFTNFLENFGIDNDKMKSIRLCSKGARFNSYLADMISFMNMINWTYKRDLFEYQTLEPIKVNTKMCDESGNIVLKSITSNGRTWTPKDDFDYLYFRKQDNIQSGQMYAFISNSNIMYVYNQIFECLSNSDNITKANVRKFLLETNYTRLSDWGLNDVDDIFTLLMIINCFENCELSDNEKIVKSIYEKVKNRVFNQ